MRELRYFAAAAAALAGALLVPLPTKDLLTPPISTITPPMDVLYAHPLNERHAFGPQGEELARLLSGDRPQTATITVTYNGFSPQAQTAFQEAVNIWQSILTSPVTI